MPSRRIPSRRFRFLVPCLVLLLMAGVAIRVFQNIHSQHRLQDERSLLPLIQQAARNHDLPVALVRALVWKESNFDSKAVGTKGEIGLMQITEGAVADWSRVNRKAVPSRSELFDPRTNLEIGCWYLSLAGRHWEGYASRDILQLAEYNAGRTKVLRDWKPQDPAQKISLEDITFPSTQEYIRKILERRAYYEQEDAKKIPALSRND